ALMPCTRMWLAVVMAVRVGGAVWRNAPAALTHCVGRQRWRCECACVAGRRRVAAGHAGARRVADAWVADRVVQLAASTSHRSRSESALVRPGCELQLLIDEPLLGLREVTEDFLQPEHFTLKSLDVELLALAMCSAPAR